MHTKSIALLTNCLSIHLSLKAENHLTVEEIGETQKKTGISLKHNSLLGYVLPFLGKLQNVINTALLVGIVEGFIYAPGRALLTGWLLPTELLLYLTSFLSPALRFWSSYHLGRHFTQEIGLRTNHKLIQTGPYSLVRHPGYMAIILGVGANHSWQYWLFDRSGVSWGKWPKGFLILSAVLTVLGVGVRVRDEEKVLERGFGDVWREYRRKTWRFVPYVY